MIANARAEIAQTVNTARRARRPMYASNAAPSSGLLPVERHRPRNPRGLAVWTVVLARGDVAHVRLHHAHTHGRRAHADHADDVDLLGGDLPDVLAERAGGVEPLDVQRPRRGDRGELEGEHVEREREEVLAAVVVPGAELLLVGGGALEGQAALDLLHDEVDADLLPLLAD